MDKITVTRIKNKYGFLRTYVNINKEYLTQLKSYLTSDFKINQISKLIKEQNEDYIQVELSDFSDFLSSLVFQADLRSEPSFYREYGNQFVGEYNQALETYFSFRGNVDYSNVTDSSARSSVVNYLLDQVIFENNIASLLQFLDSIKHLLDVTYKIHKQRDLAYAKDNVLDSLQYIVSYNELQKYKQKYEEMLSEIPLDLNKVQHYLKQLQQIILEDWKKGITPLEEYHPGDEFKFICHSTHTSEFKGDFFTFLVSCSLLTEEFNDTYRSGYGFIFDASNIVAADGEDMYVNNNSVDEKDMFASTSIPKISSIGKIIKQCQFNKKEKEKNGTSEKIYSEVVIKGFNPIGIFCLTVGGKSLDFNYQSAKKLQQQFPQLPIIEIDLTYYKEANQLIWYRNNLIREIEKQINPNTPFKNDNYYDLYAYFWKQYLKLKKNSEYKESDIIALYRENSELISLQLTPQKLLSGQYSIEAIRYALIHNYQYNLQKIFSGHFLPYDLKFLGNVFYEYADNVFLNSAFPGIGDLIKIVHMLDIENINVNLISQQATITIASITDVLRSALNDKASLVKDQVQQLTNNKNELLHAYHTREMDIKQNKKYRQTMEYAVYYTLACASYNESEKELRRVQTGQGETQHTYDVQKKLYKELQDEQNLLLKHRLINFFKLQKLRKRMLALSFKLSHLKFNLSSYEERIQRLQFELAEIKYHFREQTNINLAEYEQALQYAQSHYQEGFEEVVTNDLIDIQYQIDMLDLKIARLNEEQQVFESLNGTKKI